MSHSGPHGPFVILVTQTVSIFPGTKAANIYSTHMDLHTDLGWMDDLRFLLPFKQYFSRIMMIGG